VKLPRIPKPSLARVRAIRPGLPHLRRDAMAGGGAPNGGAPIGAAPNGVARPPEEDARILRRTRLRLMGVSGALTLLILVVLGVAIYGVVARNLDDSARTALASYADRPHRLVSGGPEAAELGGAIFDIGVAPDGTVIPPSGGKLPAGLPNQASLKAATSSPTGIDIRPWTSPDGTPYTIESAQAIGPGGSGWLIQFVQNRSAEAHLLTTLFWILLVGGAAALLASLAAGYFYSGRALVPIRQSIARRQAALQRQREFTANASHELRTPLTVIRTSVEDLRRNRRKRVDEVGEALDDIDSEVRLVTALVDDMLLLARTDSGVVQVDRVPLDLADVAAEAGALLSSLGVERGVAVLLDPLPAPISGDPVRLRQLVTILVDNAIRHSPSGTTVTVHVQPEAGSALLEVEDQGPGIKPENMELIFERFWRADDAPAGGTGLGLAIAKWIVEQHHGAIGAENRPEGGARFWARLPAAAASADASAGGEETAFEGLGADPAYGTAESRWSPGEGGKPIS
jgi:two-component system, OmpR family, sensor histidine kinase CiaH